VAQGFFRFLLSCFGTSTCHPISFDEIYMLEFASLVECDYFFARVGKEAQRHSFYRCFATTTPYLGFLMIAVHVYLFLPYFFAASELFSGLMSLPDPSLGENPLLSAYLGCLSRKYNASYQSIIQ